MIDMQQVPSIHKLKVNTDKFNLIKSGYLKFWITENRDNFHIKDLVCICEFTNGLETGRELQVQISYISRYAQRDNYIVFGFDICGFGD